MSVYVRAKHTYCSDKILLTPRTHISIADQRMAVHLIAGTVWGVGEAMGSFPQVTQRGCPLYIL